MEKQLSDLKVEAAQSRAIKVGEEKEKLRMENEREVKKMKSELSQSKE
jgi:hypothetical protein